VLSILQFPDLFTVGAIAFVVTLVAMLSVLIATRGKNKNHLKDTITRSFYLSLGLALALTLGINAIYFAIFQQPYPGETLGGSLRLAIFSAGCVLIWSGLVSIWDMFERRWRDNKPVESATITLTSSAIKTEEKPNIVKVLRRFNVRWEEYAKQTERDRWPSPALNELKIEARALSRTLFDYLAEQQDSLPPSQLGIIQKLAPALQKFGNWKVIGLGNMSWREMDLAGADAYNLSNELIEELSD
jgi:Ca2+/Na+ antiporter